MATKLESWLALTKEAPIDPDLPICDPHHHLWDRPNDRYLLKELHQDTGSGHNIVETVFVECSAMYRKKGPVEMRPVGETEFVQSVADQSASGQYGQAAVISGIVGFADFTLGAYVRPVLEAHMAASLADSAESGTGPPGMRIPTLFRIEARPRACFWIQSFGKDLRSW